MNKITALIAVLMIFLSSLAYAGGDKNCGDKAQGPAGTSGQGDVNQNQPPANP